MFDYSNLKKLQGMLSKRAFVPIDAKAAQAAPPPDAGGMPPPGGDPAAMGGAPMDPAAMGGGMPPMDPAAMGGGMPPMDPGMMAGGMPPGPPPGGPMDPMMGMPPPEGGGRPTSPDGEPLMTFEEWLNITKKMKSFLVGDGGAGGAGNQGSQQADPQTLAAIDAKLDAVINGIGG